MAEDEKKAKPTAGLAPLKADSITQNLGRTTSVQKGNDPAAQPGIDQHTRSHLGRKLKASYDDLVNQPVPDKFLELLEELERREKME